MLAVAHREPPRGRTRGFTLIELMVAIAVAAVLMLVAAPGFVSFQRNSELSALANTLVAAINAGKGEAMKVGRRAYVVPLDGATWTSGWRVYVDSDGDGAFNDATDATVLLQTRLPGHIEAAGTGTASAGAPYVLFNPSGYPVSSANGFGNVTINLARNDVAASEQPAQTRRVKVAVTGRVRVCKPSSATDSSCAASDRSGD